MVSLGRHLASLRQCYSG